MFSIQQKREISEAVQKALRDTNHPELPEEEICFTLHVEGRGDLGYSSYADIKNNGQVMFPVANPHNESQDKR
jgi:hypothetical protein